NPLASNGQNIRSAWFGTACCPANIARLVSSLGNYIYGQSATSVWVNLFVNSNTRLKIGADSVRVFTETKYPWEGGVNVKVEPDTRKKFAVHIRIPGWARGEASPGALYRYLQQKISTVEFQVNGKKVDVLTEDGYAVIEREWAKGDRISFSL